MTDEEMINRLRSEYNITHKQCCAIANRLEALVKKNTLSKCFYCNQPLPAMRFLKNQDMCKKCEKKRLDNNE